MSTKKPDPEKAARLKAAWQGRFSTVAEAALFLGVSASTFASHQNGTRGFDDKTAAHYAERLGVEVMWLLYAKGNSPAPARRQSADFVPAVVPLPRRGALPLDLPVHGTAAGSQAGGAFSFAGGVVDHVRRPPALEHARNAYAIFVTGSSMEPAYVAGDLLFVHPDRHPSIGDTVVIETQAGENADVEAFLGILVRRTEKKIIVRKLNPTATMEFDTRQLKRLHKVLRTRELFGI